jgi:hypothetical protein
MNERDLQEAVGRLPKSIEPPRDLWPGIEARLRRRWRRWYWIPVATAAALTAVLIGRGGGGGDEAWTVTWLAGAGAPTLRVGQWVETDDSSRAVIQVGDIGHVEVKPGSRLRLLGANATDHRLALDRGEIYARVSAPPRLFFVETPAGVAIDLGCAYTLRVDATGNGYLEVTSGAVEFEWSGRRAIVPLTFRIEIRPGFGPGVPVVAGASDDFRRALAALEFAGDQTALRRVLALARPDDAISLWHLLARTTGAARVAVNERLADLVPPPAGVTREAVLRLEPRALDTYWNWLPHSVWLKGLKKKTLTPS